MDSLRRHWPTAARAGALSAALLLLVPVALVFADIGVAMDTGKVAITQQLDKGGTYELPIIGVRNPGTERSVYQMGVSHILGQPERDPLPAWFTFTPREFTLEPGATQAVRTTLDIPTGAAPDEYSALIQAQIAPSGEGGQVGAAAAARLTFAVRPSTIVEAWLLRSRRWIAGGAPWSYALPALAAVWAGAWWLRQRFQVNLHINRRG